MDAKKLKKQKEAAAKLSKPKPVLLPSGSWRCQVMVRGRRIDVIEDDPALAHAKALAIKEGLVEEEKKEDAQPITLTKAIDQYVGQKEGVLSPSTIRGYGIIQRNRFKTLMKRDVYKITKADVQRAVSEEAKIVGAKTVYNAYGLIRPVLKEYGVDVFGVKLPQRIKPRKDYLQPKDIGKLIAAAAGDKCEVEILIAVWLGMRRSEICGLCWDCVDFDRKILTVRRTYVPDKNHKWVLKEGAKNESSQRTVPCPDYIMDRIKAIHKRGCSGRVFRESPETLRKHVHAVCQKAGITDTTVHGLRHTNAAVMKSLGVDDAHAMERGGWKTEQTYKQTYSYVFDQEAQNADKEIDGFFSNLHIDLHTDSESDDK